MKLNVRRLKAERVANGLSQDEVARALGMTRSSYSLKENGHRNWTVENLVKFCDLVGIESDQIGVFFMRSPFDKTNKAG